MNEEPAGHPPRHEHLPDPELMPRWVPVVIGVILVTIATLAVVTGMRYRDSTLVDIVKPRADMRRGDAPAPPGEPEPGGSRMMSGVPEANEPVAGDARAEIRGGGPEGVSTIIRIRARRGMLVKADPRDAVVYVNDVPVGRAREFDSEDEVYDFAEPGSYDVRLIAPGYRERHFVVTATHDAELEIAAIEAKLEREPRP